MEFDWDAARAARAELNGEAKTFRVGGEVFELPLEYPIEAAEQFSVADWRAGIETLIGEAGLAVVMRQKPSNPDLKAMSDALSEMYDLGDSGNLPASSDS